MPTVVFITTLFGFITTQSETRYWVSALLFQWALQVNKRVNIAEQRFVLNTAVLLHQAVSPSGRHRAVERNSWW